MAENIESIDNLLEVKNLQKFFPIQKGFLRQTIGHVRAVDDVSLTIKRGETLGLVGESGCGKTTLMRTLLGLIPPTSGSVELGSEISDGLNSNRLEDLSAPDLRKYRRQLGVVFQDPMGALNPRMLIKDIITEPLVIHGKQQGLRKRALELLEMVGLKPEHLYRFPHQFSGGQRQRIVIARALSLEPKILFLDEPTSALDVSVQAQILNLLNDLQERLNLTYIFISHDLSVIRYMCDRVAVMYLGKFVEEADSDDIFSNPKHPYTQALVSAIPSFDPNKKTNRIVLDGDVPSPIDPPSGCTFRTRSKTEHCNHCKSEPPIFKEISPNHSIAFCQCCLDISGNHTSE